MINSKIQVGIICPCDIEYAKCKGILKLSNESELSGRLISSRKEKEKQRDGSSFDNALVNNRITSLCLI